MKESIQPIPETRTVGRDYLELNGEYFLEQSPYPPLADFAEIQFLIGNTEIVPKALMTMAHTPSSPYSRVHLSATADGLPSVLRTIGESYYEVRICDLVFGEITGLILNDQAGTAVVEYSMKRANWSPFGQFYKQHDAAKYPDVIPQQKIELQKYDDGWRVRR